MNTQESPLRGGLQPPLALGARRRRALGLPVAQPAAPPRRPAEAALFDGARLALDGHTALEERTRTFEGILLRGELPSDVTLPEDDAAGAIALVAVAAVRRALYAAHLFLVTRPYCMLAGICTCAIAPGARSRPPRRSTRWRPSTCITTRADWTGASASSECERTCGGPSALPATGREALHHRRRGRNGRSVLVARTAAQRTTVPAAARGRRPRAGPRTCKTRRGRVEASVGAALAWAAAHPAAPPVHIDLGRAPAGLRRPSASRTPSRNSGSQARAFTARERAGPRAPLLRRRQGARRRDAALLRRRDGRPLQPALRVQLPARRQGARGYLAGCRGVARRAARKRARCARAGRVELQRRQLRAFAKDPALGGLWLPDVIQNKVDVYRRGEQEWRGRRARRRQRARHRRVAYSLAADTRLRARADPLLRQLAARRGVDVPTLILRWHVDAGHCGDPAARATRAVGESGRALPRARAAAPPSAPPSTPSRTSSPARATGRRRRLLPPCESGLGQCLIVPAVSLERGSFRNRGCE